MASGSAVKEGETIGKTSTIDLAPTLYELLEIDSPNFVEGEILSELWKEKRLMGVKQAGEEQELTPIK